MTRSRQSHLISDGLILLTAILWGMGFSFQKHAMLYLGPFQFIFWRFLVSGIFALLIFLLANKGNMSFLWSKNIRQGGFLLGIVFFLGALTQQVGVIHTSIANAGFITATYVIIVPILLIGRGTKTSISHWMLTLLALVGLLLINGVKSLSFDNYLGDALLLISAICWALHMIMSRKFGKNQSFNWLLALIIWQSLLCSGLSFLVFLVSPEQWGMANLNLAWQDIVYAGVISAFIANFLQILALAKANPKHAAILFSTESIFAAIFGWLWLEEIMTFGAMIGGSLIVVSGIISQLLLIKAR
ncbi:MAG: DMT family transporter [SAR324 cluster bacterium]|nr:DMT family transporter [SAR324 cluster bacterium]